MIEVQQDIIFLSLSPRFSSWMSENDWYPPKFASDFEGSKPSGFRDAGFFSHQTLQFNPSQARPSWGVTIVTSAPVGM